MPLDGVKIHFGVTDPRAYYNYRLGHVGSVRSGRAARAMLSRGSKRVRLTTAEEEMVLHMAFNGIMLNSEVAEIMWPDPDNQPDFWVNTMHSRVCQLRKKLEKLGVTIVTINRQGWGMRDL